MSGRAFLVGTMLLFFAGMALTPAAKAGPEQGPQRFVATNGNDANDGSFERPWRTVRHALGQLSAGDTLNLRGGTYHEGALTLRLQGTAAEPIVIQSYPGEQAWISGGVGSFETAPNDEWELVDSSLQLYRSRQTVSYSDTLGGWLVDHDVHLIRYLDYALLTSTKYDGVPSYMGPGIFGQDGYVYIRLQPNPNEQTDSEGNPLTSLPTEFDPNRNRISIFTSHGLLALNGAAHIVLRDLKLGPAHYTIELTGGSHHVEIADNIILLKNIGVLARSGTSNIEVHHNDVTMGYPEWFYWGDVKGASWRPAGESGWNSFSISGSWKDSWIHHNVLRNSFDGIAVSSGSVDSHVTDNIIIRSRDDAIDLTQSVENIEVARNILRHCFEGISVNSTSSSPGPGAYIHHNIIDVSSLHRAERDADCDDFCTKWHSGIPFGGHGCGDGGCDGITWKIYNNTILARDAIRQTPSRGSHTTYNNVIFDFGNSRFTPGAVSAGNVFWRMEGGLSGFSEPYGLEVDPGFDLVAIQSRRYDPAALWEIYRPSSAQVFTVGQPYAGLGWPGTAEVNYRGAVSAEAVTPIFADVPFSHPYHGDIEALYQAGYTAGCATAPLQYCPDATMNRAESAVFVERGIHGTSGVPAQPTSQTFGDLPLDSWAAKWAEALWVDGYTAGCGTNPLIYCPWQGHTRAEGCVFYLSMLNGPDYLPQQPAQQIFADVALDTWYAKWVQAAYDAGLLEPCQTSPEMRFCPDDPLTRALAAHMMVKAKQLEPP